MQIVPSQLPLGSGLCLSKLNSFYIITEAWHNSSETGGEKKILRKLQFFKMATICSKLYQCVYRKQKMLTAQVQSISCVQYMAFHLWQDPV